MLCVHIDFPVKNKKVVCTTNNFHQKLATTQKFKMVNLDNLQSVKWQNIIQTEQKFCSVWVKFYTQDTNNNHEIEENRCCMYR